VDLLAEKVTPGRIVHRRVNRARGAMTTMRDRVMGTASDGVSTATDRVGEAATSAAHAVGEAPQAVRRGTEGNPLAAGLIAFGAGWLISSLAPASKREQRLAEQAKDWATEHGQPVAEQVAGDLKENLREPAKHAAESVKTTATDAASTVADETRTAASDVTNRAQEARSSVQEQRT